MYTQSTGYKSVSFSQSRPALAIKGMKALTQAKKENDLSAFFRIKSIFTFALGCTLLLFFTSFTMQLFPKSTQAQAETSADKQTNSIIIQLISELKLEKKLSISYEENKDSNVRKQLVKQRLNMDLALTDLEHKSASLKSSQKKELELLLKSIHEITSFRNQVDGSKLQQHEIDQFYTSLVNIGIERLGNINQLTSSELSYLQLN